MASNRPPKKEKTFLRRPPPHFFCSNWWKATAEIVGLSYDIIWKTTKCSRGHEKEQTLGVNGIWMDILPLFDHAQLGLKFALISPRFDALLVDKHFDGKTELTIWRTIAIRKCIGMPKPFFVGKSLGFPLHEAKLYVFMEGTFLFSKFLTKAPIYFCGLQLDILLRLTSPTILSDLNIDSIDSVRLFPAVIGDLDGPNESFVKSMKPWPFAGSTNGADWLLTTFGLGIEMGHLERCFMVQYIEPGSIIHSDIWRAYGGIPQLPNGYQHLIVNLQQNFVNPHIKMNYTSSKTQRRWRRRTTTTSTTLFADDAKLLPALLKPAFQVEQFTLEPFFELHLEVMDRRDPFAARAHHTLVYIHPFYNGNGRTARLLMNFVLMRRGFQPIILPEETRDEYYECLVAASSEAKNITPFINFVSSILRVLKTAPKRQMPKKGI
ncbi:hypothetical protein niasHS_011313 [Heterodera schachtii]|uniref:Fido domain-containing protein n=1 Tax=Heterodera schachtii TaxID=97005 RepID=A0ABD2IW21_HETSC